MSKSDNGTDPAAGAELVQIDSPQALAQLLAGMSEAPAQSAEEAQAIRFSIIAELLAAETEDDLWKELPTWSSKEVVGRRFEVRSVQAYRSKFTSADGLQGGFLACKAVDLDSGELGILNTGAMRLCARIAWYHIHGRLPVRLEITTRGETANGYPIIDAALV